MHVSHLIKIHSSYIGSCSYDRMNLVTGGYMVKWTVRTSGSAIYEKVNTNCYM